MEMLDLQQKLKTFVDNRWLVFVCAIWVQSCAGIGYLFGSISPVIKSAMGYNQRQVAWLGVAKDLGDSIGLLAGHLCEILPIWGLMLIGVLQNFIGYGAVWLVVTQKLPSLPLWAVSFGFLGKIFCLVSEKKDGRSNLVRISSVCLLPVGGRETWYLVGPPKMRSLTLWW